MSTLTKSPLRVAYLALAMAQQTLRRYTHKYSPKKYTQHQLFACLALKTFFKTDYRGITVLLRDLADLRQALRLTAVPHWTTLHKAGRRLLRRRATRRLLTRILQHHRRGRRRARRAAFDSTGLDCGHASSYYVRRHARDGKTWQRTTYRRYGKLELAVNCATHEVLAALPARGPRVDVDRFVPLLDEALRRVRVDTALADAGYDSEPNHRYAREERGVRSVIPATLGRPTSKPPTGRYRRRMKQRLNKDYCQYGQRWQVETVISMIKRRLSAVLYARSYHAQCREMMLLVLTYGLMLVVS
jgi:hypothetical protein